MSQVGFSAMDSVPMIQRFHLCGNEFQDQPFLPFDVSSFWHRPSIDPENQINVLNHLVLYEGTTLQSGERPRVHAFDTTHNKFFHNRIVLGVVTTSKKTFMPITPTVTLAQIIDSMPVRQDKTRKGFLILSACKLDEMRPPMREPWDDRHWANWHAWKDPALMRATFGRTAVACTWTPTLSQDDPALSFYLSFDSDSSFVNFFIMGRDFSRRFPVFFSPTSGSSNLSSLILIHFANSLFSFDGEVHSQQ
jgi:hypothetical protein